jgi:photosystem II stability/assembly factor-like uncharacterized protein
MRHFLKFAAVLAIGMGLSGLASAQSVWDLRNPLTTPNNLQGVTWAGGTTNLFVAVGANGTIMTSPTGATWTSRTSPVTNVVLYAVTWSSTQNLFVAVGAGGTILTSTNGTTWTSRTAPSTTNALYGVSNNGGQFVAVGAAGTIFTSSNGTDWSAATWSTTPVTGILNSVAWSPTLSMYVAVGDAGAMATSANGTSWATAASTAGANALYSVTWGGGLFVTMGNAGTGRYSPNGSTWNTGNAVTNGAYISSVVVGDELVAVGSAGTIQTSTSGSTWTARTSGVSAILNAVTWNGTKYVAVGNGGMILTAPSGGTAWTQTSSSFAQLLAVDSGAGLRAAVGVGGVILTSTDDITWTPRASGTTKTLNSVAWVGTGFVAVGLTGTIVTSNVDGTVWTPQTYVPTSGSSTANLNGVTYVSPTRILAVSTAGHTAVSTNGGTTWGTLNVSASNLFYNIATGPAGIVAVGENGIIRHMTSLTGTSFATRTSPVAGTHLNSVTYMGDKFVAVGYSGAIVTSPDGVTWTQRQSGVTATLNSVAWTGNVAVAVGSGGVVLTSPNGIDWTPRPSGVSQALYGVTWTGNLITSVGNNGTILTSSPSALPPVPVPVTPAAEATGVPVNPTFSWNASGGATSYRLQVSPASTFTLLTIDDSTITGTSRTTGPLSVDTKYYWRVRASGTTGSSAYSPEQGFTVASAALSAPSLTAPANTATGVQTSTNLVWSAFAGATSYHVQFGTDSNFAVMSINDSTIVDSFRILPNLAVNTTYYWRVKAVGATGVSGWSSRWSFTTVPPAPAVPALNTPAHNAIAFPFPPATPGNVTWNAVSGAATYRVQVSTDSNFASLLVDDSTLTGTSKAVSTGLVANGVYYWRVRAKNAGGVSPYSAFRMFTTATAPPGKPTLGSPAHLATGVNVFTDFSWQAVSGAVTYHLQVSTDSTFATFFFRDSTLTGTSRNAGQLNNGTIYYWRVSAKNPAGAGVFSDRRSFTSGQAPTTAPAAPTLVSPATFATGISPTSAVLTWSAPATATGYRVQVSTSPNFTTFAFQDSTVTGLSSTVTTLAGSTEYYWRVYARNHIGWGSPAEARSFVTLAVVPAVPVLDTPTAFATGLQPAAVSLSWGAVPGATSYRVQVSTSNSVSGTGAFVTTVVNDSIGVANRTVGPLANNTAYYWHVLARNSAGASSYSPTRQFTTGILPAPAAPVLISPAAFDTGIALAGALSWSAVAGASTYRVQLSTMSDFSTLIINDSGAFTSRNYVGLAEGKEHYWRVYAGNASGSSAWSARRFTTRIATAIRAQVGVLGRSLMGDDVLRFSLPHKSRVIVRMYTPGGKRVAPDYDAVLDRGHHTLPLPSELKSSFFLVDFEAGSFRQVLKVHP